MTKERPIIEMLERLCAIDSRTRDGAEGATAVAGVVAEELGRLDFACELVEPPEQDLPRGKHLLASRGSGSTPDIVLLGHGDTVLSPAGVPFRVETEKGRVFGSGVSDMKGGVVVMLEALNLAFDEDPSVRDANLLVVLNASEEIPTLAFGELLRRRCRGARACLNFEPGLPGPNGERLVVTARKGIQRGCITCGGRSAHAGNHHARGANAIRELARKIEAVESLTDYQRECTANVGAVAGGHTYNQVADEAVAQFEVRAFDPARLEELMKQVDTLCAQATVRSGDGETTCTVSVEWRPGFPPMPENPGTQALFEKYGEVSRARDGIEVSSSRRGGAADGNFIADQVPVLDGLGAVGGEFHTPWEWADLPSMTTGARAASGLITQLVKEQASA